MHESDCVTAWCKALYVYRLWTSHPCFRIYLYIHVYLFPKSTNTEACATHVALCFWSFTTGHHQPRDLCVPLWCNGSKLRKKWLNSLVAQTLYSSSEVWACYLISFFNQIPTCEWFLILRGSATNTTKTLICLKETGVRHPHIMSHSTLNSEHNWELDSCIQVRNQQTCTSNNQY